MTDVGESFEPDEVNRAFYDRVFADVYQPLFPAIQPHLQRLAQRAHEGDETASEG
jgi:hypothetical protein